MACLPTDFRCRPKPSYMCNFQELADAINSGGFDLEMVPYCMRATSAATGISIGDIISRNLFYDVTTTPPTLVNTTYYNSTTNLEVTEAAVNAATFEDCTVDYESKCVCYVDAGGTQFLRTFWLDAVAQEIIGYNDTDNEGNAYSIAEGDVTVCGGNDEDVEPLCMTDDNGQFIRHVVYLGGAILSSFDTLSDGVTGYTAVGAVTACDDSDLDVEQTCMEDDNGSFVRHTVYTDGAVTSTFDTTEDMVTPYVVVGTVTLCEPCVEWAEVLCDNTYTVAPNGQIIFPELQADWVGSTGTTLDRDTCTTDIEQYKAVTTTSAITAVSQNTLLLTAFPNAIVDNGDAFETYDRNSGAIVNTGVVSGWIPSSSQDGIRSFATSPVTGTILAITNSPTGADAIDLNIFDQATGVFTNPDAYGSITQDANGGIAADLDGTFLIARKNGADSFVIDRILENGSFVNTVFTGNGAALGGTIIHDIEIDRTTGDLIVVLDTGTFVWDILTGTPTGAHPCLTQTTGRVSAVLPYDEGTIVDGTLESSVPFQRVFTSCDGVVTSVDLDLEGVAYTTVGTVEVCPQEVTTIIEQFETEQLILCDIVETGDVFEFDAPASWVDTGQATEFADCSNPNVEDIQGVVAPFVSSTFATSPATDLIYFFNNNTGAQNGDAWGTYDRKNQTWVVSPNPVSGINALPVNQDGVRWVSVDPTTGILYGITVDASGTLFPDIYTFDTATGAFTYLFTLPFDNIGGNGLAINDNGDMYVLRRNPSPAQFELIEVDKVTGAVLSTPFVETGWGNVIWMDFDRTTGNLVISKTTGGVDIYDGTTFANLGAHPCKATGSGNAVSLIPYTAGDTVGATITTSTEFVRHTIYDMTTGLEVSTFDTELDMVTPYVVAGTVGLCTVTDTDIDVEQQCMTDDVGDFIRHYVYSDGTLASTFDTDVDGAAYTVTGTPTLCDAPTAVLTATAAYIAPTGVNTYSLPANINSISMTALVVATGITVDTGAGGVPLLLGQTVTFTAAEGEALDDTTFDVTTGAGDTVGISTISLT